MKKVSKYSLIGLSIIIGLIMLITVFQQIPLNEVKKSFQETTFSVVGSFLITSLALMLLLSWRWYIIVNTRRKVSFMKLFPYKIIGYGISFITPAAKIGGEPLRAMMLQREGFSFGEGFSTVAIDKIIDIATSGFLFIIGVLFAISTFAIPESATIFLMIFSVIIIGLIIWFYFIMISDKNVIHSIFKKLNLHKIPKLKKVEENIIEMDKTIISFYKENKSSFNKAMIISAVAWFLMFLEYKLALMMVGINSISFSGLFLIISMMGFAYLIPVPLALGVLEAGQISTFSLLNLSNGAAVGLATVIRFRDFLWTLIAMVILISKGVNFKKAYDKSINREGRDKYAKKLEKFPTKKSNKTTNKKNTIKKIRKN